MEQTLKGGEENTVDAVEGQTETSEASEVSSSFSFWNQFFCFFGKHCSKK